MPEGVLSVRQNTHFYSKRWVDRQNSLVIRCTPPPPRSASGIGLGRETPMDTDGPELYDGSTRQPAPENLRFRLVNPLMEWDFSVSLGLGVYKSMSLLSPCAFVV